MGRSRKQQWRSGDFFVIPLADDSYCIGQVVATEPLTLKNAPGCTFFNHRVKSIPADVPGVLNDGTLVAALYVTRDLLDSGVWRVFAHGNPPEVQSYFPNILALREAGFVGQRIHGSGIVRKLMNALNGLHPWDAFFEPDYLDKLLWSPDRKPSAVRYKRDFPEAK